MESAARSAVEIKCACCLDPTDDPIQLNTRIEDPDSEYLVCPECAVDVANQFLKAYHYEYDFPPRWGSVLLEVSQFTRFLPPGFAIYYADRVEEYLTPKRLRIYCKQRRIKYPRPDDHQLEDVQEGVVSGEGIVEECGQFLGTRRAKPVAFHCAKCTNRALFTCGYCSQTDRLDNGRSGAHQCSEGGDEDDAAFAGLVRGQHYQICPKPHCHTRIELREACNQLTCPGACNTEFCMICGQEAAHDSDHWAAGKPCPRFNQPGAEDAVFDEYPGDFDDGDEEFDNDPEDLNVPDLLLLGLNVRVPDLIGREAMMIANDEQALVNNKLQTALDHWKTWPENEHFLRDEEELFWAYEYWSSRRTERVLELLPVHRKITELLRYLSVTLAFRAIYPRVGMHLTLPSLELFQRILLCFQEAYETSIQELSAHKFPLHGLEILGRHRTEIELLYHDLDERRGEDLSSGVAIRLPTRDSREAAITQLVHVEGVINQSFIHGWRCEHLQAARRLLDSMARMMKHQDRDLSTDTVEDLQYHVASIEQCALEVDFHQSCLEEKPCFKLFDHIEDAVEEYEAFLRAVRDFDPERVILHYRRGWMNEYPS